MTAVNLPNAITLFRLVLTAVFVAMAALDSVVGFRIALVAFILAAISDWLDGYLARRMQLVTSLGKLLDPLADKILVCAGFVFLSAEGFAPVWVTSLILAREFLVTGIPPNPDDGSVDVRFTYDLNGVLEAEATVVKTGKKQQLVISSLAKTPLSKSELKKAIEKMEALKVDWRDEPENRLLLAQSERLFAELDHVARANLDGLLTVFEHALEQRDRAGVEEIRATLEQFISLHDGELNWEDRDESSDDPFGTA